MVSKKHGEFTESTAKISPRVGGKFTVWEGGIDGSNVLLKPGKEIVQLWRCEMDDWPAGHYSTLKLAFSSSKGGCKVVLTQSRIPASCASEIAQGWHQYYWEPLKAYLSR